MRIISKLFGGIEMTWKKVIIFAILAGIYTGVINQIPGLKGTSFRDIAVTLEWWILFAVIIAANVQSAKESAVKIFVFFLISQPLVFLVELPMLGLQNSMMYYRGWIIPTLLTLPGGYIAYYAKKNSVVGALVLSAATGILAVNLASYGSECVHHFPSHLLTTVFIICEIPVLVWALQKKLINRCIVLMITAAVLLTGIFLNQDSLVSYSGPLPEGSWVCVTEFTDGSSMTVEDGAYHYSFNSDKFVDKTIVFENEAGETFTLDAARSDGFVQLTPGE